MSNRSRTLSLRLKRGFTSKLLTDKRTKISTLTISLSGISAQSQPPAQSLDAEELYRRSRSRSPISARIRSQVRSGEGRKSVYNVSTVLATSKSSRVESSGYTQCFVTSLPSP